MLVLTRKVGEALLLPSCGVQVTVVETRGKRVRLGVIAPPETSVLRAEILQKRKGASRNDEPEAAEPPQ